VCYSTCLRGSDLCSPAGPARQACPRLRTIGSMQRLLSTFVIGFLIVASLSAAAATEMRLALVIGNASYKANPLATPINDAGLIAQALKETGFQVTAQNDLDGEK